MFNFNVEDYPFGPELEEALVAFPEFRGSRPLGQDYGYVKFHLAKRPGGCDWGGDARLRKIHQNEGRQLPAGLVQGQGSDAGVWTLERDEPCAGSGGRTAYCCPSCARALAQGR